MPVAQAPAPVFARTLRALRPGAVLAVLALLAALAAPQALAQSASRQQLYARALESFQWVMAEESRAMRRDLWGKVLERFEAVLRAGTDTEFAPKSLFYIGRSYQELSNRSGLRNDAVRAADAYQRAANRFPPGHSWVDDCLYRKAEVTYRRLGDPRTAAADLRELLAAYPNGDQAKAASALLTQITGKAQPAPAAQAAQTPRASMPAPPPASSASATVTPKIRAAYDRAVGDFNTLRASKATTSRQMRDNAARLAEVYRAVPRATLGARAAYFAGFASEEAGRRSGAREDYAQAAEYYGRAADAFDRKDSWRDDAIFRKAQVAYRNLGDEDKAYADLLLLLAEYPDGDQIKPARALLAEMDQARAKALPRPEGPMTAPAPIPALADGAPLPEDVATGTFAEATGPGVLTGVRYSSGDDFTRIVLDISGPVAFKHARLPADPAQGKTHRMYVDLDKTTLGPELKRKVEIPGGFLQSIRAGQNTASTARVVLDFKDEQEYHVLTLPDPPRIVIDVFARQSVARDRQAQQAQQQAAAPATRPDDARTPGKKEATTAHDVLAQLGMTVRTIMIDAGHGGRDPGALQYVTTKDSKGRAQKSIRTKEKDITLRAARILGKTLQERGYQVLYTRTDDTKIQLEDRVLAANIKKADLFISLHCNANNSSSVRGFETYYLGKARNDIVLRLAAKENNVDPVKISDTQKIVMDLVHSFKIEESKVLARHVQKNCVRQLSAKYKGIVDHGARSAPFFVLIGAKMPAVLVEIGYITHPAEADLLRSDAYLQRVADGITAGIDSYRQELQSGRL